jgi:hypothetical protein
VELQALPAALISAIPVRDPYPAWKGGPTLWHAPRRRFVGASWTRTTDEWIEDSRYLGVKSSKSVE